MKIEHQSLYVTGTPNRLVVYAEGLPSKQGGSVSVITGPPVSVAVSEDGSWAKAAEGFAKKQGVGVDRLMRIETGKGDYLAVEIVEKGRSVDAVLKESVPRWISSVRFPKVMKWDSTDVRFARPIRWILALLGGKHLKFEFGSISSASFTRLSPYSEDDIQVEAPEHYFEIVKKSRIILDRDKREGKVREEAEKAAAASGDRLVEDGELCAMVANLVESPVAMAGSFEGRFLELPRDVIVTALKSHQRYFSVESKSGKLRPGFIAFANGARRNKAEILKGYERVLQARLEDASFYYREDTSISLEDMSRRLDGIVWLEGLGTLADKADRISSIGEWICRIWRPEEILLGEKVERAARLAKADIASEMVKDGKEFTKLQGYIGREYARAAGEDDEVAEALFEHYLPRFSGDALPSTATGTVLALADRFDTIAGCYIQGYEPTGSQDPYALRRQAVGVLRICSEKGVPLEIPEALSLSLDQYGESSAALTREDRSRLITGMVDLFTQRLTTILRGKGYDYDIVSAALSAPWQFPFAVEDLVRRLQGMRGSDKLVTFTLAMKRIVNILPREYRRPVGRKEVYEAMHGFSEERKDGYAFDPALFTEESERVLFKEVSIASGKLRELKPEETGRSVEILYTLVPAVNRYFDEVLVNCEDNTVRENRISFLIALSRISGRFCNFQEIVSELGQ
jgi:glycyl-tRNA synthetase beta chain